MVDRYINPKAKLQDLGTVISDKAARVILSAGVSDPAVCVYYEMPQGHEVAAVLSWAGAPHDHSTIPLTQVQASASRIVDFYIVERAVIDPFRV